MAVTQRLQQDLQHEVVAHGSWRGDRSRFRSSIERVSGVR